MKNYCTNFLQAALLSILVISGLIFPGKPLVGQTNPISEPLPCRTSESIAEWYEAHPESKKEREAFELSLQNSGTHKTGAVYTYVIPVVFHVYGTTQYGYPVDSAIIDTALALLNQDFHGLNYDYDSVHSQFTGLRETLDIKFALARLDTNGNPTTGIINHPVTAGYGNWQGYDSLIRLDAWDNYKYMNLYIMNDLYNDNVLNNSGIAWYPDTWMSDWNLARIVYNGAYLGINCNTWSPDFASTLTHEFGHFFGLIHTFEGGCVSPNDYVADTPPCTAGQGCHSSDTSSTPLNCNNDLVNAENYMDYNPSCYRMFTEGQITRFVAGMHHPARITLWQYSNLVATGLSGLVTSRNTVEKETSLIVYPNPAAEKVSFQLKGIEGNFSIDIRTVSGQSIYNSRTEITSHQFSGEIDCASFAPGMYLFSISGKNFQETQKLIIE